MSQAARRLPREREHHRAPERSSTTQLDAPFRQALGLSTSFRNEDAAKVLMTEVDPIVQKTLGELNR